MSNRGAAALILCVFAIGCRTDPNRALREQELRLMEDRVYQLEECVRQYQAALAVSERDNLQLRCDCAEPALIERSPASRSRPRDRRSAAPNTPAPNTPTGSPQRHSERSGSSASVPSPNRHLTPPQVEMGDPRMEASPSRDPARQNESMRPDQTRGMIAPPGTHVGEDAGEDPAEVPVTESDAKVKRVALAKLATGGYDAEPDAGDEGVTLILRPLDSEGKLVHAAAPVAVVVMDPEQFGDAARVARWDFSVDEVARSFRRSGLSEGIHLNARWPAAAPTNSELLLFVRYHDPGRTPFGNESDDSNRSPGSGSRASRDKTPDVGKRVVPRRTGFDADRSLGRPSARYPAKDLSPATLPAADVARRTKPEPRVATKTESFLTAMVADPVVPGQSVGGRFQEGMVRKTRTTRRGIAATKDGLVRGVCRGYPCTVKFRGRLSGSANVSA